MSENEEHVAEPADVQTVAIAPDAGEQPTVPGVSADVVGTMKIDVPAEPAATQALSDEEAPGTLLLTVPGEVPGTMLLTAAGEAPGTMLLTTPGDVSQHPAPQEYRRIGPGVPAAQKEPGTSGIDPATAAAWHGAPPRKPRRALLRGWLLPLAVLVGVIILLLWRHIGGQLSVSGVAASAGTPSIGCDSTETITATLRTNGDGGTVVYRWVRSDGTVSDALRQPVNDGTEQVDVVLRWAFSGQGSMHALATIDVESPDTASAVASFAYNCP
jgi:hypothetical protein